MQTATTDTAHLGGDPATLPHPPRITRRPRVGVPVRLVGRLDVLTTVDGLATHCVQHSTVSCKANGESHGTR